MVPAVAVLVQTCLNIFGISWDYTEWVGKVLAIIEAAFVVLMLMGIIADPTTSGLSDSMRAMTYNVPAPNITEVQDVIDQGHRITYPDDGKDDIKIGGTD